MEEYRLLVEDYQKKLEDQKRHCSLTLVKPQLLVEPTNLRYMLNGPIASAEADISYLGYGRNAWHSTWINRYYPGSVSLFDKELKKTAEGLRVQGSQFKISRRPAIFLRFGTLSVVLMSINDRPFSAYEELLAETLPWKLSAFWASRSFQVPNCLLVFSLSGWRPDLFPKNSKNQVAEPQGVGRQLRWAPTANSQTQDGFIEFRDRFFQKLLALSSPS